MTHISNETNFLLQLSMLKGVGPATLRKAASLPGINSLDISEIAGQIPAVDRALSDSRAWDSARILADRQVAQACKEKAFIVSALDADYPENLKKTKDDPFLLYLKGEFPLPRVPVVAIIGTRSPTKHGRIIAERVTQHFASRGVSILSGLALGCDSIAHQAAVDSSAHTIAVLAHGLQTVSPSSNRLLAGNILDSGGTLISEYPFGAEPRPAHFVQRDRTQAGLSNGVVMIQSDTKGGSLHASRASLSYGRWLAIPYPTEVDIHNKEPKIQANLILAGTDLTAKLNLLKSERPASLEQIIIMRSRADYRLCPLELPGLTSAEQTSESKQLTVPW